MNSLQKDYTLNQIIDIWLKEKKDDVNLKIQSYQRYEIIINLYVRNTIGKVKCSEITEKQISDYFKKGKMEMMSISVKKAVFGIIKSSLETAYRLNCCKYINLKKIKLKSKKNEIIVFTKREHKKLDRFLMTDMNIRKVVLLLCMYTGIRIGEASGLKWKDIDTNKKTLKINRTVQRIKNQEKKSQSKTILITGTPKSECSMRTIPIPNFLIPILKKYKTEEDVYILSNSQKIYDCRLLESFYKRTLKKCKIDYLKFHTLRHTFATRSIEAGIDPKTLSEILGHSSVDITLKLYVHPTYTMKKKSIEKTARFMKK